MKVVILLSAWRPCERTDATMTEKKPCSLQWVISRDVLTLMYASANRCLQRATSLKAVVNNNNRKKKKEKKKKKKKGPVTR